MPPRSVLPTLLLGTAVGVPLGALAAPEVALPVALGLAATLAAGWRRAASVVFALVLVGSTLRVGIARGTPQLAPRTERSIAGTVTGVRTEPEAYLRLTAPRELAGFRLRIPASAAGSRLHPGDTVSGECWTGRLPGPSLRWRLTGTVGTCASLRGARTVPGRGPFRTLAALRERAADRIAAHYPEPESDFLEGLLVGAPPDGSRELAGELRRAGVAHLVAVSGYNLTVVVGVLGAFVLPLLGRRAGTFAVVGGLTAFAGISGFEPSVLRAGAMAVLQLVAYLLGRPAALPRLLGLAVLLAAWVEPALPLFDLGFQLSVAATAGIAFASDPIERRLRALPPGPLRAGAAAALAALAATTPVLLLTVGRVSLVAPLTTVLLAPAVPLAMLLGALSLVPVPGVAELLTAGTHALLAGMLGAARLAAALPFAAVDLPPWSLLAPLAVLPLALLRRRSPAPALPGWRAR